jgi:hypothetical protein
MSLDISHWISNITLFSEKSSVISAQTNLKSEIVMLQSVGCQIFNCVDFHALESQVLCHGDTVIIYSLLPFTIASTRLSSVF